MIDSKIANAKLAKNCDVNTAVCVKNAGPIAEVAIRNTEPNNNLLWFLVNSKSLSRCLSFKFLPIF